MPLLDEHPHRESAATYRRRRIVVGACATLALSLAVLGASRVRSGDDVVTAAAEPRATADGTTTDPSSPGPASTDPASTDPAGPDPNRITPTSGDPQSTATTGTIATTSPAPAPTSSTGSVTTAVSTSAHANPSAFLACVRDRESRGDYTAVSPGAQTFGAYQIDQVTWNSTALHAGLTHLYAIQPNLVTPADQDQLAMALLEWQGAGPWAGGCWP